MRRLIPAALLALLLLPVGALPALAQDGWSVTVGVPVNYKFTKDENTGEAPDAKSPSGLRVMVGTPVRLGIGFANYSAGFADATWPWSERDIDYSFLEVQFNLPVDPVIFAIGFGLGKATFDPPSVAAGPFVWTFNESSAQEWFLVGGFRVTDNLDLQASVHAMTIDAEFDVNGAPGSGDIGAILTALGIGWHF